MIGQRLGTFTIDRELGVGGMGRVYAATGPEGVVALKVVHPHLLETPGFFKRFLREAQIGQAVEHENVVRTLDCDALGGHHYLVMEYVEGQTLADLQGELDKVPEELCRHVAREICKGLSAIHDEGVVHRDLKPENVLITADHVVKVMDLGVARLADEKLRLSQSGAFVGSAEYAAPEQFGGDVDHRCDLHALGLLLYELSSGRHPYRGDDFRTVMRNVCDVEPRRLGEVNPQLSAYFEEVVHTLLAKSREERFDDASALLLVLEQGEDSDWWHERARQLQATTKRPLRRIRIPRETAVYGRDDELAKLRALFVAASAGEGQVVLVEGEAGIGKSRLIDELVARLQADGEDLNFLFGSYPPGGAATAAGGFSSAYREHFGDAGSEPYLTQTPLLVPGFDAVLRGESAPDGSQQLTKDSLATCFVHATRNLAAERPTIVLIDDLHFAPEEARTLFTALAQAVPGHRVLLVGTMRPGVSEEWIANVSRLDQTSRLDVHRLGPKDLIRLLRDSFASEALADQLGAQIAVKSDGNPFFAFEIIRGLREGQFITQRDDGTWVSTQVIDEIQIPSSVRDLVNARVADLSDDERNLLDVAACWGYEFDASLIGEALGMRRLPVLQMMAKIQKRDRLVRSSGRQFVFDHHQVQETLYGALPEMLREEYHAALAEALEQRTGAAEHDPAGVDGSLCVDLCDHYLRGGRGPSAVRYLPATQAHLRSGHLNDQVVALSERALSVPELLVGTHRATVLLRVVDALDFLGRRTRQEECAREAQRLAREAADDELRRRAANALGELYLRTSRYDDAEAVFRQVLELPGDIEDQDSVAAATLNLAGVALNRGRIEEARELLEPLHERSVEIGDRRGAAAASGNLAYVSLAQGRLREAEGHFSQAIAHCRDIGRRQNEAVLTGGLGSVFHLRGRFLEAQEQYERQLGLSRAIGYRYGEVLALGNLGLVLDAQGRVFEAQEQFDRELALCREIDDEQGVARALGSLGDVLLAQGRLQEAESMYTRKLELSRAFGNQVSEAFALSGLGGVHDARGAVLECDEKLSACLAKSQEIGHRTLECGARLLLGSMRATRLREGHGDVGSVRDALVAARDLASELGMIGTHVLARCELALLPGGDVEGAASAVAEQEGRMTRSERRRARLLLWKATGDRSHLDQAKRLLDDALANSPPEYHESMLTNVRVNREIMEAWREEFGEDGGSESVTRVGEA